MDVLQDHIDVRATEQPKLPIRLCQRARTSGEDHLRAWTVFDGEVDTRQTWAVARVAGSQRAAYNRSSPRQVEYRIKIVEVLAKGAATA